MINMPIKSLHIRQILLAAFLLVALLPIVIMSILAYREARIALTTEIRHDMQTRVAATAMTIDHQMFERLQNLASWSQQEVMQDIRLGDIDKRLSGFLHELNTSYASVYEVLYVQDLHGKVIAASQPNWIGNTMPVQMPWISVPMLPEPIHLMPLHQNTLPMMTNIKDPIDGQVIGTLVAVYKWDVILNILKNSSSSRSNVILRDEKAHVISQTKQIDAQTDNLIQAAANTQMIPALRWSLVMAQSKQEVMAPVRKMTHMFIGLLVASIGLATLIGIPVARMLTKPLEKLTQFAIHYVHSDNQSVPPVGGPEEIQALSNAFTKMLHDLETSKQALTHAAKLAVAGEMAAAMSHEVKTPLGILRSSAQLLMREPNLNAEAIEVCGFIMSETDRLNRLMNTLLDTARPRQPNFTDTDLAQLLQQAIGMMRMQADKKQIAITLEAPETLHLICDREQITQVIFNLILNAVQILSPSSRIHLRVLGDETRVTLSVIDSGVGVPENQQSKLFEPFFTQREGGIGLGLAVVRKIIESHQGEISVHNGDVATGLTGAVFEVTLPFNPALSVIQQ